MPSYDYHQLMEWSELIADAIIRKTSPIQDEISRRQADILYGTQWMKMAVSSGKVQGRRIGSGKNSKIVFSRLELDCLKVSTNAMITTFETK